MREGGIAALGHDVGSSWPEIKGQGGGNYLPQLSLSVVMRLNTGWPGWCATRSVTK